jgi:hypothetical protein
LVCWYLRYVDDNVPVSFPWQGWQIFTVVAGLSAASGLQKTAAAELAKFEDKEVIGPLAEALEFGDKKVAEVARQALTKSLARLVPADSQLLNDDQRKCLHRALKAEYQWEFRAAILRALEQVGDSRDIAAVKSIANMEAATFNEKDLKRTAEACLPLVSERAEKEIASKTLLRAASNDAQSGESLLRPASDSADHDESVLLRPITGD